MNRNPLRFPIFCLTRPFRVVRIHSLLFGIMFFSFHGFPGKMALNAGVAAVEFPRLGVRFSSPNEMLCRQQINEIWKTNKMSMNKFQLKLCTQLSPVSGSIVRRV